MGERFAGRYELVDHLGDGGAGSVWRAWDARRGAYVAAKLLRQRDAGALLRFVREQSLRVAHPHVVAPTGWAAEDDDVLLTMDLVGGGSVASLLGDYGRLPPATVRVLLDQLLDALEAVHGAGLVHRDVKPANLLLEPTGAGRPFLRLADFGIAALRDEPRLTATGYVVGTSGYVAPEVLQGAEPAPAQDVWAAGVVGLQALTGRRPGPGAEPPGGPLTQWLLTLVDPDPGRRPDVRTARRTLAALPDLAGPTAEPVEVFEHLPPLPPGWSATGPTGRTAPVAADPAPAPPAAAPPAGATRTATLVEPAPETTPRPGRTAAAVRLVAVVLLLLLAALAFSRAAQGDGSPGSRDTSGEACTFTDVGASRTVDGRVETCRRLDGRYVWTSG